MLTLRDEGRAEGMQQPHVARGHTVTAAWCSGDPYNETNWGWFEDQKKVKTGIRLRLGIGGTDDLDGLEENHDPFVEVCRTELLLLRCNEEDRADEPID